MPWPEMVRAMLRAWWVFLPIFVVGAAVSYAIYPVGSEFISTAEIMVVPPEGENAVLQSGRAVFRSPAVIAELELNDDEYLAELRADGITDDFFVDPNSTFPIVGVQVWASTYGDSLDGVDRIAADFVDRLDQVQADRGVEGRARLRSEIVDISLPAPRRPGSRRALAGLLIGVTMVAGGAAYGYDQFVRRDPEPELVTA